MKKKKKRASKVIFLWRLPTSPRGLLLLLDGEGGVRIEGPTRCGVCLLFLTPSTTTTAQVQQSAVLVPFATYALFSLSLRFRIIRNARRVLSLPLPLLSHTEKGPLCWLYFSESCCYISSFALARESTRSYVRKGTSLSSLHLPRLSFFLSFSLSHSFFPCLSFSLSLSLSLLQSQSETLSFEKQAFGFKHLHTII